LAHLPRLLALCAALAAAPPLAARADEPVRAISVPAKATAGAPRLHVDMGTAAVVTGAELAAAVGLALLKDQLVAPACRWCEPPQLDRWARDQLRWTDGAPAAKASDALQLAIPIGAAVTLGIWAADAGGGREVAEDLTVMAEAVAGSVLLTQGVKYAAARLRPYAWAGGGTGSPDELMSFWSGHTAFAFSSAAAATQVARLRGRPGWKWLAVVTFAAATATAYFRVAADEHWLTDVLVGAAAGTAIGLVVPVLVMRPAEGARPAVTLAPAPGGLALRF
jgi:membrane-associated phospholipid phosphatase